MLMSHTMEIITSIVGLIDLFLVTAAVANYMNGFFEEQEKKNEQRKNIRKDD